MEANSQTESAQEGVADTPFVPELGFYQPSTEESWESYQALLGVVEQQLGGYSTSVLCGVAHEVLSVLKCENNQNLAGKKAEIEKLLNRIPDHTFEQLVEISGCIKDYFRDDALFVPEEGFYQPRTEDTWTAYKLLLDVIRQQLGDQPEMILCVFAQQVLEIVKDREIERPETRKQMIENVLYPISDDNFNLLMVVGGMIHDFNARVGPAFGTNHTDGIDQSFDQNRNGWSVRREQVDWEEQVVNEGPVQEPDQENQMAWNSYDDNGVADSEDISKRLSQLTTDDNDDTVFDDFDLDHDDDEDEAEEQDNDDDDDDDIEAEEQDDDDDDDVEEDDEDLAQEDEDDGVEEDEDWVMVDVATL